jgi:hypothetical protein
MLFPGHLESFFDAKKVGKSRTVIEVIVEEGKGLAFVKIDCGPVIFAVSNLFLEMLCLGCTVVEGCHVLGRKGAKIWVKTMLRLDRCWVVWILFSNVTQTVGVSIDDLFQ